MTATKLLWLVGAFFICAFMPVRSIDASSDHYDEAKIIKAMFSKLEKALNNRAQPLEKVHLLHEVIAQNAVFDVNFENAQIESGLENSMRLDKAAYINSFLLGNRFVGDYKAEISVESVEEEAHGWRSRVVIEESGVALSPLFEKQLDKAFVSRTTCVSDHDAHLQIVKSHCRTSVNYHKDI